MKNPEPDAWIGADGCWPWPCGIMKRKNGKGMAPPGPPWPPPSSSPSEPGPWPIWAAGLMLARCTTLIDTTAGATLATMSAKLPGEACAVKRPGALTAPSGDCAWASQPPAPASSRAPAPTAAVERDLIFRLDICFLSSGGRRPIDPDAWRGVPPPRPTRLNWDPPPGDAA